MWMKISLLLRSSSHKCSTDGTALDTYSVIPELITSTGATGRRRGASGSHPAIY